MTGKTGTLVTLLSVLARQIVTANTDSIERVWTHGEELESNSFYRIHFIFNSLYLSQSCQKFTQTTSNWFSKTSTKNISMPNPISAVSLEFLFCIPRCKPVNWNYFHYLRIRPLPVTPQNLNEYIKCFYKLSIMILYSFSILLGIFCLK